MSMIKLVVSATTNYGLGLLLYILIYLSCMLAFFKTFDIVNLKWWVVVTPLVLTVVVLYKIRKNNG